jgi:hypothetical protein
MILLWFNHLYAEEEVDGVVIEGVETIEDVIVENEDIQAPSADEKSESSSEYTKAKVAVINKIFGKGETGVVLKDKPITLNDIQIKLHSCNQRSSGYVAHLTIRPKSGKEVFSGYLYYPEISKEVYKNSYYLVNFLGCE